MEKIISLKKESWTSSLGNSILATLAFSAIIALCLLLSLRCGGSAPDKKEPGTEQKEKAKKLSEAAPPKKESSPLVYQVSIQGAITPSAIEKLNAALGKAEEKKARALLITLDTPGGLVNSMDSMIRRILSAQIPVITYVSPRGAACGSAGVYIMYASHIAAMSPATNIGSATPVAMGGGGGGGGREDKKDGEGGVFPAFDRIPKTAGADDALNMKRKLLNHARAQIRSLAQYHGRNASFAEKTITQASNVTAGEAHKLRVIDMLADNESILLQRAHGRQVRMSTGKERLDLKGAKIVHIKTDFRQRVLDIIANPNLAYILMMLGILGIIAEIQNPGLIFPGAIGSVSLLLGLYAMQTLPLDYTGLALIVLAFVFFVLEVYIISYGLLSLAGLISLVLGSLMLVRSAGEFTGLSLSLVIVVSLLTGALVVIVLRLAARSQKVKEVSGFAKLLEEEGLSKTPIDSQKGRVLIHGELWQARSQGETIPANSPVRIISHQGLTLFVKSLEKPGQGEAT